MVFCYFFTILCHEFYPPQACLYGLKKIIHAAIAYKILPDPPNNSHNKKRINIEDE